MLRRAVLFVGFLIAILLAMASCGGGNDEAGNAKKVLYISGIPDQDVSTLEARFNSVARYLSQETGLDVRYLASADYAAVVTAFKNGQVPLAFYGGLTGVQARLAVPGALAIAQRDIDDHFQSAFIARKGLGVKTLADLKGKTFTFGSASSTSGFVMPRYFLAEAKIDPDKDFKAVSYSGSHDKTWKLVESGAFDAGVLNANVWETRVKENAVDLSKVEVFLTTPAYYNYHWVVRPDLDKAYGKGAMEKIRNALLSIDAGRGGIEKEIMAAFQAQKFIPTQNENYQALEQVARQLGVVN